MTILDLPDRNGDHGDARAGERDSLLPGNRCSRGSLILFLVVLLAGGAAGDVHGTESRVFITLSQESYGDPDGDWSAMSTLALLRSLIPDDGGITVGLPGARALTITDDTAHCILERLPASGVARALPEGLGDVAFDPETCKTTPGRSIPYRRKTGLLFNTLLGETITLTLNMILDPDLARTPGARDALDRANGALAGREVGLSITDLHDAVKSINDARSAADSGGGREGDHVPAALAPRVVAGAAWGSGPSVLYTVTPEMGTSPVDIVVYDVTGRRVRSLESTVQSPGEYAVDWDLGDDAGRRVASGIYFFRVHVGRERVTLKQLVFSR